MQPRTVDERPERIFRSGSSTPDSIIIICSDRERLFVGTSAEKLVKEANLNLVPVESVQTFISDRRTIRHRFDLMPLAIAVQSGPIKT